MRWLKWAAAATLLYLALVVVGGVLVVEGALRPPRRAVSSTSAGFDRVEIRAADGARLVGWFSAGTHDGVMLLHGVADNRDGLRAQAGMLHRHGYSVLLPDSRAHGDSEGEVATYGVLEREDVRRWGEWLRARAHAQCVYGFGVSMGAAILLQATAIESFCAVVAEAPFASFREIAYQRIGQAFHTGPWLGRTLLRPLVEVGFWRARRRYQVDFASASPLFAVTQTSTPVLLIHGTADDNIPLQHCQLLEEARAMPLWEVPHAGHCAAYSTSPQEFETRVVDWFFAHHG